MSQTPIAHADSLRIGSVDFVSPDEIKVLLDIEAPDSVALNAGGARPFPRVNGYVLLPVDDAYLVGQIEWLTIERSNFPKRRGVQDFGVVDLPFPLRRMSVNPLGTLRKQPGAVEVYKFSRGADALPSVGSPAVLPTDIQLRSIVQSGDRRRVLIGSSALAGDAEVRIDPDRMFGRHLAVLGNTGSGKSCSVAGLIRWSLEAARESDPAGPSPNARFIILDPNGEYSRAFAADSGLKARILKVSQEAPGALTVPLWLWNTAEWTAFTKASAKTQRPVLIQALRFVRDDSGLPAEDPNHAARRFLRTVVLTLRAERNGGSPWGAFPKAKNFLEKVEKWLVSLNSLAEGLGEGDGAAKLAELCAGIESLCAPRRVKWAHADFTLPEIEGLQSLVSAAHSALGGLDSETVPLDADSPRPFSGEALLRSVEATAEMMGVTEHVETLLIRLRGLLADSHMRAVIENPAAITLDEWLSTNIGTGPDGEALTVIDLSLVPSEIVHVVTAVIARMAFEALQRYRQEYGVTLPTVIVMEEAHTFIKRYQDNIDDQDSSSVCCQVFERIAREGRKFGLGLVLSSQRPSELSATVLSQCNTYLLHRLSNDRDQELVHRLVPDNLRGLLRELPSLPSQQAILLGWASELPVLTRMRDLPQSQQPKSDDPDFWDVWTGRDDGGNPVVRSVNWKPIADDWQGKPRQPQARTVEQGATSAKPRRKRANGD